MAGRVREQNGKWHMVYQYYDESGKLRQKSKSTKLPVKGNKRKAEAMLAEWVKEMEKQSPEVLHSKDQLFLDFMKEWLENTIVFDVRPNTLTQYKMVYNGYIVKHKPFHGVKLRELTPVIMQSYFTAQLQAGLSPNTVRKHYANIHKCLDHAVTNLRILSANPADHMSLGTKQEFTVEDFEIDYLIAVERLFKGDDIEVPLKLAMYLGVRRSEACGLRWRDVDFGRRQLYIRHTAIVNNGKVMYVEDTKNKKSKRILPLSDTMCSYLAEVRAKQEENKLLFGSQYFASELDLVCVKPDGTPINPDFVTHHFQRKLKSNELKVIRFHDLRHAAVGILQDEDEDMKDISDFLGHSEIGTTANIYARHKAKRSTVEKISEAFSVAMRSENPPTGVSRDVCQA